MRFTFEYTFTKVLKASCAYLHTPYSINYTYRLVIQSFRGVNLITNQCRKSNYCCTRLINQQSTEYFSIKFVSTVWDRHATPQLLLFFIYFIRNWESTYQENKLKSFRLSYTRQCQFVWLIFFGLSASCRTRWTLIKYYLFRLFGFGHGNFRRAFQAVSNIPHEPKNESIFGREFFF